MVTVVPGYPQGSNELSSNVASFVLGFLVLLFSHSFVELVSHHFLQVLYWLLKIYLEKHTLSP